MVRWKDAQDNDQSKEYANEKDARRAEKWLRDNGADGIDFAVRMKNRDAKQAEKLEPKVAENQPLTDAWYDK